MSTVVPSVSVHNLSDESNTLSMSNQMMKNKLVTRRDINTSVESISELNLSDDSEDETSEVDSSTERKAEKIGSFVESYLTAETRTTAAEKKKPAVTTFTPRKPRRVALISSTRRKSPIKNGATMFETRHDANNLDKNLHEDASHVLEQNLGAEASVDLGLEDSVEAGPVSPVVRKSPRKHKRKLSSSPRPVSESPAEKRQKIPETAEFQENCELKLSFSPVKKNPGSEQRPETPTIVEALGLVRSDSSELRQSPVREVNLPVAETPKQELQISINNVKSPVKKSKKTDKKSSEKSSSKIDKLTLDKKLSSSSSTVSQQPEEVKNKFGLTKSHFFTFQKKLPFGVFEEDLQ